MSADTKGMDRRCLSARVMQPWGEARVASHLLSFVSSRWLVSSGDDGGRAQLLPSKERVASEGASVGDSEGGGSRGLALVVVPVPLPLPRALSLLLSAV
jgi:hypothetical protein